jgi:hypothetical protein
MLGKFYGCGINDDMEASDSFIVWFIQIVDDNFNFVLFLGNLEIILMFDHADNTVSFIVTDIISELEYINIKLG